MSGDETATSRNASGMWVFWWVLLALATAVVVATVLLIVLAGAGNWFTVIGSACTIAVSIIQLVSIRKRNRQRP
ncbi:hypothetical protein ACIQLJ_04905 [Microbacterium sp. NPDC091313]